MVHSERKLERAEGLVDDLAAILAVFWNHLLRLIRGNLRPDPARLRERLERAIARIQANLERSRERIGRLEERIDRLEELIKETDDPARVQDLNDRKHLAERPEPQGQGEGLAPAAAA